jgi:hypothetical protein
LIEAFSQDLLGISHQIARSEQLYGRPTPPHTDAKVGPLVFQLATAKDLKVTFRYTGVKPTDHWLYQTYVDGVRERSFSFGPQLWAKSGFLAPDGGVTLTFTLGGGWARGTRVRTEVFLEGNLLSARQYTIP